MALEAGTRLGVYEIRSALGAGGMGEVYRARDTRLQRDVALKILPDAFASDAERLARFEREAQVLASLNHPNIAAIHGLEESGDVRALVLELVEGDTLADEIGRRAGPSGPAGLTVEDALPIARQIADALEAAHEQGIVHRDLKPANIKVRPDGTVKVLDFGLAKLTQASGPRAQASGGDRSVGLQPDFTMSPTITTPAMTQMGVIMGTAAYMSPEQAKGREADKRSDVWAFGAVLYEMLAGRRAFDGDDMSDTLASVLKIDPDWTRLPADVPPAVRTLIQRCLVKDRRQRVSDISTAKFILAELENVGGSQTAAPRAAHAAPPRSLWRRVLPTAAAVVLTAVIVGTAWAVRPAPGPAPFSQFSFTLPEGQAFSGTAVQSLAISSDGTRLAYVANSRIYLRPIGELEPHEVAGTLSAGLGVGTPLFAPDGQSIAFFSLGGSTDGRTGVTLKRIPITGGAPLTLATTDVPVGASWGSDGILIGQGRGGIVRVAPNGGTPERIVSVAADEEAHGPQMLPDGRTVLFTLAKAGAIDRWDQAKVVAQSLVDGTRRILRDGASDARYLPSGHLLYVVGGTMIAVPFDAGSLTETGDPVPVVVGVRRATAGITGTADLAVSDTGTVMYRPGPAITTTTTRSLVLGDNSGDSTLLKVPPAVYSHPRVSADGTLLAVGRGDGQGSSIWIYELSGKTEIRRVTFEGSNRFPVWSGDRRVTFQSDRGGGRAIWWQSVDGGQAEQLTKPGQGEEHIPESWSPDGRHLLFSILKESAYSLWVLTLEGKNIESFGNVRASEPLGASFSPDGRWVVYAAAAAAGLVSPDRGIFVEPFPHRPGEKHQLPRSVLDYHPRWAPEGGTIYYVPGSARAIVSVPVRTHPSITFGTPVELTRAPRPGVLSVDTRGYDVLPGGRFVSVAPASSGSAVSTTELRVMLNWFEELKRLAPPK